MTASDDVSAPFQDPNTGQWYTFDFTTGTTQPADAPSDSSSLPFGSPDASATDGAPDPASLGTTDQATAPSSVTPLQAPVSTDSAGTVALDTTPPPPPAPSLPTASASDRGTWVDLRTGGTDDDPQLESALITADHENNGDQGTYKYLYVFPRGGAAYPTVADEGDGQDQYRTS